MFGVESFFPLVPNADTYNMSRADISDDKIFFDYLEYSGISERNIM